MMAPVGITPSSLMDPEFHATGDVHSLWHWMRENSPVHWHPPNDFPGFWSFTRYEDARAVYGNPKVFSSANGVLLRPYKFGTDPGSGLALALSDPPCHRHLRSVVATSFTEAFVYSLEDSIQSKVSTLLMRAVAKGECEFAHDVAARLSLYMISELMGVPHCDHELIFDWTCEAFATGRSLILHSELMRYFIDLMERRIKAPENDIMSDLVSKSVQGKALTETQILLNCENMIGAAENAGLSMAGGVLAFLVHPEQWEKLKRHRSLMKRSIDEVLRWTSSATHSMRTVTEPTVIRGHTLNTGDKVVIWIPSANRDHDVFQYPEHFDITRNSSRHIAFGMGEHFCIGNVLARAQMRALLSGLLDSPYRFEICGEVVPLRSIAVCGPAELPIRIHAH